MTGGAGAGDYTEKTFNQEQYPMDNASLAKLSGTHGAPSDEVVVDEFAIYTLSTTPPTAGLYVFDTVIFGVRARSGTLYDNIGLFDLGKAKSRARQLEGNAHLRKSVLAQNVGLSDKKLIAEHGKASLADAAGRARIAHDTPLADAARAAQTMQSGTTIAGSKPV